MLYLTNDGYESSGSSRRLHPFVMLEKPCIGSNTFSAYIVKINVDAAKMY
jgi:hypothetical protein